MIEVLAPHRNIAAPKIEHVLFILRAWQPEDSGARLDSRRRLLEYRANPRSAEYMLECAREFMTRYAPGAAADVLVERNAAVPEKARAWIRHVHTAPNELGQHDTIVFLFPDAIGLGWEAIERGMLSLRARQYFVVNGRRRVFVWNDASRRLLARRRFLYRVSSLLELLFAPIVLVAAVCFALADALTGDVEG
jgi:hypothetical protein